MVHSYSKIRQPPLQTTLGRKVITNQQWSPSPTGWFKANVDAVIKEDYDKEGLGVVIKKSEGKCVAATMKASIFHESVACAEAEATRLGLEIAENANYLPLIIEIDSQRVVDLVLKKKKKDTKLNFLDCL